jgi:class 3 adenylate cyclase
MDSSRATVTFLFADIQGSTALLRSLRDEYVGVLQEYRRILRDAVSAHHGEVVDTEGDGLFAAFPRASDAVPAALAAQHAVAAHAWPAGAIIRVRMGIHTGEAHRSSEGYVGLAVHQAQRVCSGARGGQVLLSEATRALVWEDLPLGVALRDLGKRTLKDVPEQQRVFLAVAGERATAPAGSGRAALHRWLVPAAIAALLVVGVTVGTLALHPDKDRLSPVAGDDGRVGSDVTGTPTARPSASPARTSSASGSTGPDASPSATGSTHSDSGSGGTNTSGGDRSGSTGSQPGGGSSQTTAPTGAHTTSAPARPGAPSISGPTGTQKTNTARFSYATANAASYRCSLDAAAFTTCGASRTVYPSANGTHTFRVYGVSAAGSGPTATRTWTIDVRSWNGKPCTRIGTPGNDTINGTSGGEVLCGMGGDDVLLPGLGTDTVDGGAGSDTASYANYPKAIGLSIKYQDAYPLAGGGEQDFLHSIENGVGTAYADELAGGTTSLFVRLYGLGGNDNINLNTGTGFADGGPGTDQCYNASETPNCEQT